MAFNISLVSGRFTIDIPLNGFDFLFPSDSVEQYKTNLSHLLSEKKQSLYLPSEDNFTKFTDTVTHHLNPNLHISTLNKIKSSQCESIFKWISENSFYSQTTAGFMKRVTSTNMLELYILVSDI